jgi:2-iminoacetate synthase ThiH
MCFIPLAYHPANTQLGGKPTTGVQDLKEIAIARLMLDNFPHIKAYWISLDTKLAQVALSFWGRRFLTGRSSTRKSSTWRGHKARRS